ncbi:2-dehydropantoate 2-reductase [Roseobacter sp. GAI101]|uniref:2-dehydropantoate 2-reductase n=1 Tax=Roseobacter sp. (strain GAI101) TaxID=391589 RepID=UPI0001871C1E|nr:2-dehydropantoate 2-reductase [Roseobacter sp. GAI101]EEB83418.1 2-dehydropantoate 2-reductase [Roseobacter sp. GAI101]
MNPDQPIVVAGAGAIGCFVGGLLAARGHPVTLLGRPRILDHIRSHGLSLTDFDGLDRVVRAADVTLSEDPTCLADARIILVCVKTGDTATVAQAIASHAAPTATILSLQNGMEAVQVLRQYLPQFDLRAGMVPFNVVPKALGCYHRATSGGIVIEAGPKDIGKHLGSPDLAFAETCQIEAVQWGKLLINLNNALNALSGLTLQAQLLCRPWRCIMAAQMAEALRVLKAHGISPASTTPLPADLIPWVLRLPTPLFSRVAAKMLTIDPTARTSMSYDLEAGKATEIDALQGAIIDMGAQKAVPTPICTRVSRRIKQARDAGQGLPDLMPSDLS